MTLHNRREQQTLQLLHEIKNTIAYHKAIGVKHYISNANFRRFMDTRPQLPENLRHLATPHSSSYQPSSQTKKQKRPSATALQQNIARCTQCSLHKKRNRDNGVIYGNRLAEDRENSAVRLMFIGDFFHGEPKKMKQFFGKNEDAMVKKMVTAIKLAETAVYLTNVIKCCIVPNTTITRKELEACTEFLHAEITAVRPEYICAMGPAAARAVIPSIKNLAHARNRFHQYTEGGLVTPVIATYHPNYLLANPEMKRPTWLDLQMLAKSMGLL